MVEQRTENPRVGSSILPLAIILFVFIFHEGSEYTTVTYNRHEGRESALRVTRRATTVPNGAQILSSRNGRSLPLEPHSDQGDHE